MAVAGVAQGLQRAGAMETVAAQPRADVRSIVARARAGAARRPVVAVGEAVRVAEGVHPGRSSTAVGRLFCPPPSPPRGLSPFATAAGCGTPSRVAHPGSGREAWTACAMITGIPACTLLL